MNEIKNVCVYCASSTQIPNIYFKTAEHLGELLAQQGINLIDGAGQQGLMGCINNAILASGGTVTGIIPHFMVEQGWHIHVMGEGRQFESATEAIETYRNELGVIDQDLPGFVIAKDGQPVGTIDDGDSVILFNFRGDRALELSRAFDGDESFDKFDRVKNPKVLYAGMLQYDADLNIPHKYLTEPPKIKYTLTEELCKHGIREYAISETQKFGHVTYFWNGNRSEKFDENLETYVEIKSDVVPFEQRPWMKSAEITDQFCAAIESGEVNVDEFFQEAKQEMLAATPDNAGAKAEEVK